MCGITGIFNLNEEPVSPVILKKMTDVIAHRGPDGEGFYTNGYIGLGHRRLAIIDLSSTGHQPMLTPDSQFVLSFNGEVYNFQELRLELGALGHDFSSRTDSEVVLHAFAQWGLEAIPKFNGMFAFAIWDSSKKSLLLARDRYGMKPLYYSLCGKTLLFGSEIKAILAHPIYKTKLNKAGLIEYLTFQNFFTEDTLFENVQILPAGTTLTIPLHAEVFPKPQRYWDFSFQEPEQPLAESEYMEELDRLFKQSINRHLISDVPVGAYLSGGVDSGSITAVASQQIPYMHSFTLGFDLRSASEAEKSFDERIQAEYMSYLYKTEHYEMVLKAGDMERILPRMVWHLEEPRVGQSYPNFYAAQLASKFVKVCLSGAGGDELFAGYPWRYYRATVNDNFEDYVDKYYGFWQRLIPNTEIKQVLQPIWSDVQHVWTRDIFRDVFKHHNTSLTRPEDYVNHSLYFEAKTFLHGLLVVEDKLSSASGLETRVPFLDNDLVNFAMRVPVSMKLSRLQEVIRRNENEAGNKNQDYFLKTQDGKLLVRKTMARYVPDKIISLTKQGFSAPDNSWFKRESLDFVKDRLLNSTARIYDYMDQVTIRDMVQEHLDGRRNRRLLIWSLLNLEQWFETFME